VNANSRIADYYNNNTPSFLRIGGATARTGNLHRSLRLTGVTSGSEAMNAIHHVILGEFVRYGLFPDGGGTVAGDRLPLLADLGCGVGATMQWMMANAAVETVGITLSEVQARLAARRLARWRLAAGGSGATLPLTATVHTGSFLCEADLRAMAGRRTIDGAYMLESFVHAHDATQVLDALSGIIAPGGLLIICDDFPTPRLLAQLGRADHEPAHAQRPTRLNRRLAADFRRGWHIHSFMSLPEVQGLAVRSGWTPLSFTDLSPFVNTSRPRDFTARVGALIARPLHLDSSFWDNVAGGAALQRLIRRGLVKYQVLVLRKTG